MLDEYEIITRLLFAALVGGLVGFERERKDWAAGIRTHMLASVAAALIMMVSSFGFNDILVHPKVMLDPSRVASSVIIGIGYLGAGMILILKRGNVKGLTTASGLWATAGIGLAAGGGMYFAASIATVIVLVILYGIQLLQKKFSHQALRKTITITVAAESDIHAVFAKIYNRNKLSDIKVQHKKSKAIIKAFVVDNQVALADLLTDFRAFPGVREVSIR